MAKCGRGSSLHLGSFLVRGASDCGLPAPLFSVLCTQGSAGSPYILTGDEPTTNFSDGSLSLTVTIASNPAADFSAPCANALSNSIKLLTIRIGAGCAEPGVIQGVYINGVLKTEGIETSVTGVST